MALTPLTNPSVTPAGVSDYQAQNTLISNAILNIDKQFPIDFVNDEIPIGTIINLSGTILKAVTAEAITGTKSRYVKVDHTLYTASYVSSLSGITYDETTRGYYDISGDIYIFDEIQAYCDNFIEQVYMQSSRDSLRSMTDIANLGYAKIGNINFPAGITIGNICFIDSGRIAIHDATANYLYAFDWDGEEWAQVGNAFSISIGTYTTVDMQMFGVNQIVVCDTTTDYLNLYSFDGTNWSLAGGYYRSAGMSNPSIAVLSSTEVALTIGTSVQLFTWSGSAFSVTGSTYNLSPYTNPKICKVNTDTIIAVDTTTLTKIVELTYSGGSWSLVGSEATFGNLSCDFIRTMGTDKFLMMRKTADVYLFEKISGVWTKGKGDGLFYSDESFDTYPDNKTIINNYETRGILYFKRLLYADS